MFVPTDTSPLDIADAITEAAGVSVLPSPPGADPARSWESVVDSTWMLYRELLGADAAAGPRVRNDEIASLAEQVRAERESLAASAGDSLRQRVNGGRWWRQRRMA